MHSNITRSVDMKSVTTSQFRHLDSFRMDQKDVVGDESGVRAPALPTVRGSMGLRSPCGMSGLAALHPRSFFLDKGETTGLPP